MMNGTNVYQIPFAPAPRLFVVGIYCRLSKDDDLQGESASISNKRELLTSVCRAQGWNIAEVYQDDGFTGLNMERPGLQRLLRDIELGKINLVITKDLSRLGRNYLQTGHLIEDFFPRHGVKAKKAFHRLLGGRGRHCGQRCLVSVFTVTKSAIDRSVFFSGFLLLMCAASAWKAYCEETGVMV